MSGTPPSDPRDVLRRALVEIRNLKEKLAAAEKKAISSEPIAVVGIGCRFAGGIDSPAAFWNALMDGRDTVAARPPARSPPGCGAGRSGYPSRTAPRMPTPRAFTSIPSSQTRTQRKHKMHRGAS